MSAILRARPRKWAWPRPAARQGAAGQRHLLLPVRPGGEQDYRPLAVSDTRNDGLSIGFAFDPAGNLSALIVADNTAPDDQLGLWRPRPAHCVQGWPGRDGYRRLQL